MSRRDLRIVYSAGPGNVLGSFEHWLANRDDPSEVAVTYSSQFFTEIRNRNATALVIATPEGGSSPLTDRQITVVHQPRASREKRGIAYHLAEFRYWLGFVEKCRRFQADIAIVSNTEHWWILGLLKRYGIQVIPTLHCTFWPKGHRPMDLKSRWIQRANSWFWRNVPSATICISPECERQVRDLTGQRMRGQIIQGRALYRRGYLDTISPPNLLENMRHFLFAGRIERYKGIFDLLTAFQQASQESTRSIQLAYAGDGSAVNELRATIRDKKLEGSVQILGKLNQEQMYEAYAGCHAVIVPTDLTFAEGLNKVAVEGALAGRPVIVSDVCPASEVLMEAAIEIPAGDLGALKNAMLRVANEESFYEQKRIACRRAEDIFYDPAQSWGAAVKKALDISVR